MTTRILPREEWYRLGGTEAAFAVNLPLDAGHVLVVESDGQIIATWALVAMWHVEGLWIAPAQRRRVGVVARLLRGMRALAGSMGVTAVQTGAVTDDVADFIRRLGGAALPGQAFVLPMETGCH